MLILLPNCKKQTNTNSPKEKIKQSADNEDFDPERCQASSKGDLFSNFKSGCLGKYCYEKECGDIAMKFRENKTFYAEYSCHGPAYTGKWRIRDNILEATAFSTETQDRVLGRSAPKMPYARRPVGLHWRARAGAPGTFLLVSKKPQAKTSR
jgi:hypothetical protein